MVGVPLAKVMGGNRDDDADRWMKVEELSKLRVKNGSTNGQGSTEELHEPHHWFHAGSLHERLPHTYSSNLCKVHHDH